MVQQKRSPSGTSSVHLLLPFARLTTIYFFISLPLPFPLSNFHHPTSTSSLNLQLHAIRAQFKLWTATNYPLYCNSPCFMYIYTIFGLFRKARYLLRVNTVTWERADGGKPRRKGSSLEGERGRDDRGGKGNEGEGYKQERISRLLNNWR